MNFRVKCASVCLGVCAFCIQAVPAQGQSLAHAEALSMARDYEGANREFRALVAAQPKNPDLRVRWAQLFIERFNKEEAVNLYREALQIKPNDTAALLGIASVMAEGFEATAKEYALKALAVDPKLYPAHEILARVALEDNDIPAAIGECDKALSISPDALGAMAIRATIDWLGDTKDSQWIGQILSRDPHHGQVYATAGYYFVLNRRYNEGIDLYRKALVLSPELWSARSELGVNLMRMGKEDEARKELELAYQNDYRDAATVNSLRLLDSYKNFVTLREGNIILRLQKKESDALAPYFFTEAERAVAVYENKYAMKMDAPIQIEVYPDHEDFAVRTMGMPGLGALGVTFGTFVAMDSPSGRPPGKFNWASTLWHELSHVFVLSATNSRVPRWFTEGVSVHEETAAAPEWGDRLSPEVILAIRDKKLLPIAELDRGFIHPTYPQQVVISYFQAGRICDYIATRWGEEKILEMIHAFAQLTPTTQVIRDHLGMEPEAFDKDFLATLEKDTQTEVHGYVEWKTKMRQLAEAAQRRQFDEVVELAPHVRELYPEYVERGSAYEYLADAYLAKENKPAAIAELRRYVKIGGQDPGTIRKLADLLAESGATREAADSLARLNYVAPQNVEIQRKLGNLRMDAKQFELAARAFRTVLAMKPSDEAGARFDLARALRGSGDEAAARDELLLALESAPNFRPAQRMLLDLSGEENK